MSATAHTETAEVSYEYDRAALRKKLAKVAEVPGVDKPDPILIVNNVQRHFGGLLAVDVDHIEVQRGAIDCVAMARISHLWSPPVSIPSAFIICGRRLEVARLRSVGPRR